MAKSIQQKFSSFKKRYKLSNEDIIKIATEYANSSLEFSRSYFTSKYNFSTSAFYKLREYAIVCYLVDNDLYEKIREKSLTNFKNNNDKNSAIPSIAYFDKLLILRTQFLNEFTTNEILDIGIKYVEGVPLKNIAIAYETGELAIKHLLKKGIINFIYDADLVEQIEKIVGSNLTAILNKRKANKKALLACYQHQISSLEFQISYYDLYYRFEVNKPSLETLKKALQVAHNKYNETLKL